MGKLLTDTEVKAIRAAQREGYGTTSDITRLLDHCEEQARLLREVLLYLEYKPGRTRDALLAEIKEAVKE